MKRASIVFTAGREGRKGESSLVMENNVPPHKLYWGNKSNQYRKATLQHNKPNR